MSGTHYRRVFSRRPVRVIVFPIVLVLAFPLYLVGGAWEGFKWWLEEARSYLRLLRNDDEA